MPAIDGRYLDAVFYLYPSSDDAEAGRSEGATGFVVSVPSDAHAGSPFHYLVTAGHVIGRGAVIARFNDTAGGTIVFPSAPGEWVRPGDGTDLAALPLGSLPAGIESFAIALELFVRHDELSEWVAPGEDAFFIGRFKYSEGRHINQPSVRFGNVSALPGEKVPMGSGGPPPQEAFLVEARSLSGYSGSPVFSLAPPSSAGFYNGRRVFGPTRFLGVDVAHLPSVARIVDTDTQAPIDARWSVQGNSGMAVVVPAWKLTELLQG